MDVTNLGLISQFLVKVTNYLILEIKYYLFYSYKFPIP